MIIFFMTLFTLFISIANAYATGTNLPYAKQEGGFAKLVTISGGVMTGIGFSMVIAVLIIVLGSITHLISHQTLVAFERFFPALIIIPLVISGFFITIQSWKQVFVKNQGGWERAGNIMAAGYNTFAEINNIMEIPGIFKNAFSRDDDDKDAGVAGLAIALIAVASGFIIAYKLINFFAQKEISKYIKVS